MLTPQKSGIAFKVPSTYRPVSGPSGIAYRWHVEEGRLEWPEDAARQLPIGWSAELTTVGGWWTRVHPEDRDKLRRARDDLARRPGEFSIQYRVGEAGRYWRVRQTGSLLPARDGESGVIEGELTFLEPVTPGQAAPSETLGAGETPLPEAEPYRYPEAVVAPLEALIARNSPARPHGGVLLLHLANLSSVLEIAGSAACEAILSDLQQQMSRLLTSADTLVRIGRDEYALLIAGGDGAELDNIATHLIRIVHDYSAISAGGPIHLTCQVGSVACEEASCTALDLMDKAYIALRSPGKIPYQRYEAKEETLRLTRQQMGLANYLRKAMQESRLRLAFQPIVSARDGAVEHYEALLRLIGEDGKISSAGALIPIAEHMGMIDMIDKLVLEMVVEELNVAPDLRLAFNVSNLTTDNVAWMHLARSLLQHRPDIATRLIVEITETAAQRDLRQTAYFVANLQELGCQVALDDFGSGYTSFRQLQALSVDSVKIDGMYIRDLTDNLDHRFFVKTMLEFAHNFGLQAVAEYVETGEIAKILIELGVDALQGYYLGKPVNHRTWLSEGEYGAERVE